MFWMNIYFILTQLEKFGMLFLFHLHHKTEMNCTHNNRLFYKRMEISIVTIKYNVNAIKYKGMTVFLEMIPVLTFIDRCRSIFVFCLEMC